MPNQLDINQRAAVVRLLLPDLEAMLRENPDEAGTVFDELHPSDGADLLAALSDEEVVTALQHLAPAQAGELLIHVDPGAAKRYLSELPSALVADLLEQMESDDRAAFLSRFDEPEQAAVLAEMQQEEREDAQTLLGHDEDTAGRLMNTDFLTVSVQGTAADALEVVQRGARDGLPFQSLYLVDESGGLKGRIALRDILASPRGRSVHEFADHDPATVRVDTDQEEVARIIQRYDLDAIPVLEQDGSIVGIVTVDDVVDILTEEATEDVQRLGAVQPLENSYFETNFLTMLQKRGLWLMILFAVGTVSGTVLRHSEAILTGTMSLILFVPLITASGGNTGAQSAALVMRALATGEVRLNDAFKIAWREAGMGLALGALLGTLGFGRAFLWHTGPGVAGVVGCTLIAVCLLGSLVGAMLPLLLKRMGIDPAIASSPFVASVVDVSGVTVYMLIATALL